MIHCKYCRKEVSSHTHYCEVEGRYLYEESDAFLVSAAVAAMTDSALLGALVGGDIVGAIVGDVLNGGSLFDD